MGDQRLWEAVIKQAVRDYRNPVKMYDRQANEHKSSARMFLFSDHPAWKEHRQWILTAAGLDSDFTFERLKAENSLRSNVLEEEDQAVDNRRKEKRMTNDMAAWLQNRKNLMISIT